jgi:hypothetical protein
VSRGTQAQALRPRPFRLRGSHPLWPWFPPRSATVRPASARSVTRAGLASNPPAATATALTRPGFGLFPVRSPLLRESRLISTPRGTKMFQFPRFPSRAYGFSTRCEGMTPRTLPHSGIPGSTPADGSPRLFAANHALHRLLAPRHPPCALRSAAPAPSRARHTPDLAQYVLPDSSHAMHLFRYASPSPTARGRPHRTPGPRDPEGSRRPAVRPGPRAASPGSRTRGRCSGLL